jgi:selenocysteine-specific translation elongation factor
MQEEREHINPELEAVLPFPPKIVQVRHENTIVPIRYNPSKGLPREDRQTQNSNIPGGLAEHKAQSGLKQQREDVISMKGLTVAVLGNADMAAALGKKGTISDVSFFNLKKGDLGITYVYPSRYPEKLQSLATALGMSDVALLVVDKLDKDLGEQIVGIDNFGIKKGFIVLRNYIGEDQLKPFIAGTTLESFKVHEDSARVLNDTFEAIKLDPIEGPVMVPIDHFFNVKGVGTVALGCVRRGSIKSHDELEAFPTGKKAFVRSIQVHDDDVQEAPYGSRVGLALKGIEADELFRGVVLAPKGTLKAPTSIELEFHINKYWKGFFKDGLILHGAVGLQDVPMEVEKVPAEGIRSGGKGKVSFRLDKPLAFISGERFIAMDLDSKGLRFAGWGTCP